jgi:pimeloyl-ACP methyl ester carboxylesterase
MTSPSHEGEDAASGPHQVRLPRVGGLTTPRAVGLVTIGILALLLIYIRVSSGDSQVSVPKGAEAGDLFLNPCTYATEDGSLAADCGTLVVPENRNDPDSRLIALPVKRIRATGSDTSEPIFRLEGGPGISNMPFSKASRFTERHDVVLVGYRGADGSSVLNCPEVESAQKKAVDFLDQDSQQRYAKAFSDCADRLTSSGVDLEGYSLPQRVDDLEAVRLALGYDRINLLSESAGTRTAMIYAWRYPQSIHRSVMIAVNPPGRYLWDPATTDDLLAHYSVLCSQDAHCSAGTDDLVASMRDTSANMPDHWLLFPIQEGNVKIGSFWGLMETTEEASPLNAPTTIEAWLSAAKGDASGFWLMSVLANLTFPESFIWGELAATGMMDAEAAKTYYRAGGDTGSILGNAATDYLWASGAWAEVWPASPDYDAYQDVLTSEVETLLVGGTVDFAAPVRFATSDLLPYLPNGQQLILAEFGHTTDFWDYQREASTRLLTSFFETGVADDSLYAPQVVEFDVGVPTDPFIAKVLLGMLVGVALAALLLLAWMVFRLDRLGSFGWKASVGLRTLSPVLLGLGGWFFSVLVVLVLWPSLFIGNQWLAVLSMGLPIGLGIYLAWVSRETNYVGFAVAMLGALMGAWLGFNAAEGLGTTLTTLVGAAMIANLGLIVVDIAWDRTEQAIS